VCVVLVGSQRVAAQGLCRLYCRSAARHPDAVPKGEWWDREQRWLLVAREVLCDPSPPAHAQDAGRLEKHSPDCHGLIRYLGAV